MFAPPRTRLVWRVARRLPDQIHVVLVQVGEPSRRKTVAARALLDRNLFVPIAGVACGHLET